MPWLATQTVGPIEIGIIVVVAALIAGWCAIFAKAGYAWGWGLLMAVPLVNIVAFLWFVFAEWPVLSEKAPR